MVFNKLSWVPFYTCAERDDTDKIRRIPRNRRVRCTRASIPAVADACEGKHRIEYCVRLDGGTGDENGDASRITYSGFMGGEFLEVVTT